METMPEFSLPATGEKHITLQDLKGHWTVIYFYPKDSTPGCTTETQDFTRLHANFQSLNARILGWNHNSMKSHEKFKAKHEVPFDLITEEEKGVMEQLGIWALKKFMGRESMGVVRTTLILNPEAEIVKRYDKVKVKEHAQTVLQDLQALQAS